MDKVFDQGTDERIPVCQLKIEMFLSETKDLRIMTASEVRDLLLDLLIEMGK